MADTAPVRVRRPGQVRDDEASPRGRGADIHRPVQVPVLRARGGDDGLGHQEGGDVLSGYSTLRVRCLGS